MAFSPEVNPYVLKSDELPEHLANHQGRRAGAWEASLASFLLLFAKYPRRCVELGSGSGAHLLGCAARDPACLHIGIEWRYKRAYRTVEKALRAGLENFFVFRGDFQKLLPDILPPQSLEGVSMHFPDPWEKKHWKKHRPLAKEFFLLLSNLIREKGYFSLKTDHAEYFESLLSLILKEPEIGQVFEIIELSRDLYASDYLASNIPTEFEGLFLSKNLPIFYLRLGRKGI
jgi:tRNA (guanine-N(7)-)-methyltransferase